MTPDLTAALVPWEVLATCVLLLVAPTLTAARERRPGAIVAQVGAMFVMLFASSSTVAYGGAAVAAGVHAWTAWPHTRTGAVQLAVAAGVAVATALVLPADHAAAFWLSLAGIALRAGVAPLHAGVASLCERAPLVQVQQAGTVIALVFVHLRFAAQDLTTAAEVAPFVVRYGAAATLVGALVTLAQRDLRGFYRGTTIAHGGMLLAAVGTASLDTFAAALLVAVTIGLALGGLGTLIVALEARVGAVIFSGPGGRAGPFPRLAAAFAIFGGAGVGLPGTAGFVADDVLLHALWLESPTSAVLVIVAAAVLAVATLIAFARVFLGPRVPSRAPDLSARERLVAAVLLVGLVTLGVAPAMLLEPAGTALGAPYTIR